MDWGEMKLGNEARAGSWRALDSVKGVGVGGRDPQKKLRQGRTRIRLYYRKTGRRCSGWTVAHSSSGEGEI